MRRGQMRLAVLADIHGNAWALEAVLRHARHYSPDQYVVLGDLLADGPDPRGTLEQLETLDGAPMVRGNTDRYLADLEGLASPRSEMPDLVATWRWGLAQVGERGRAYLARLPTHAWLETPAGPILAAHGVPEDDEAEVLPSQPGSADLLRRAGARVALVGHTHAPFVWHTADLLVINPGSVGISRSTGWRASYGIVDLSVEGVAVRHEQVAWDVAEFVRAFDGGVPVNRKAAPMLEELRAWRT